MVVCLYAPAWGDHATSALTAELLAIAPRITMGSEVVWADARGLSAQETALALVERCIACGVNEVRAGVAAAPITAELAARTAQPNTAIVVDGDESAFIADLPLAVFAGREQLLTLLEGVGVRLCGELAALDREAVEVRFGADALQLWQWCHAQDQRRVLATPTPDRLHASTEFIDYVVTDPERLIFVANALLGSICDQLRSRGEHARRILLTLTLANRTTWERTIRPARSTASRVVWLRLTRALLERLTVPDAVTGLQIEVVATEPATAVQGDLFDPGFATASAVESAVGRLLETQGNIVVQAETSAHPLAEARTSWVKPDMPDLARLSAMADNDTPELRLRLLPEPKPVLVETVSRRDHVLPIRFRDGQWRQLVTAAGPDRISGGKWDESYAREYFRGVTVEGRMVWLFRDARNDNWYVHGYWD